MTSSHMPPVYATSIFWSHQPTLCVIPKSEYLKPPLRPLESSKIDRVEPLISVVIVLYTVVKFVSCLIAIMSEFGAL